MLSITLMGTPRPPFFPLPHLLLSPVLVPPVFDRYLLLPPVFSSLEISSPSNEQGDIAGTPDRGALQRKVNELVQFAREHGYRRDELVRLIEAAP
jgi:hypothetical protein